MAFLTPLVGAALLEWFLWLTAFLFCLWKVYQKAENWIGRLLAVLNAVVFTCLRYALPSTQPVTAQY